MNCINCRKELTGGIDTFGIVGAELCQQCFFDRQPDSERVQLFKDELRTLRRRIQSQEDEKEYLQRQMDKIDEEIDDLTAEIEAKEDALSRLADLPLPDAWVVPVHLILKGGPVK